MREFGGREQGWSGFVQRKLMLSSGFPGAWFFTFLVRQKNEDVVTFYQT